MKKRLIILLVTLVVAAYGIAVPLFVVRSQTEYIRTEENVIGTFNAPVVGIVFGAGIDEDGTPRDMLKDRLQVASDLYNRGVIRNILVSGDNPRENYDEPTAMYNYLVNNLGIPGNMIERDYAGRRTYDTCARAYELWGVRHAVLITQQYHLPRALLTCKKRGIDSVGVSASLQPYYGSASRLIRELFAIHKAILDVFVLPPQYISGEKERNLEL